MSLKIAALLLALAPVSAAATVATPATLDTVLKTAKPGDTITLAPGSYAPIGLRDRHWTRAITIDASAAELRSARFDNVGGMTWHGGSFGGADVEQVGFRVEVGDHIAIDGVTFRHFANVGIVLGRVTDARLTNNVVTDSGSDGIDIAMSQRVVVDHNRCTDFKPLPGAHADCIQLWSKPNLAPIADVTLTNNVAIGDMQGFTGFDGPLDRVVLENNFVKVTAWHGIALYDCHDCILRHNRAESMPNPHYPDARAWIKFQGGANNIDCDNRAKDYPDAPNRKKCKTAA